MRRGRPIPELVLTAEERDTWQRWASRPKTAQALALRARIVLACAEGTSNTAVSVRLRLSMPTVGKWRGRFVARRLDGLLDEPRPGAPRRIRDGRGGTCFSVPCSLRFRPIPPRPTSKLFRASRPFFLTGRGGSKLLAYSFFYLDAVSS